MSACQVRWGTHIINDMAAGLVIHGVDHYAQRCVISKMRSELYMHTFVIAILFIPIAILGLATVSRN